MRALHTWLAMASVSTLWFPRDAAATPDTGPAFDPFAAISRGSSAFPVTVATEGNPDLGFTPEVSGRVKRCSESYLPYTADDPSCEYTTAADYVWSSYTNDEDAYLASAASAAETMQYGQLGTIWTSSMVDQFDEDGAVDATVGFPVFGRYLWAGHLLYSPGSTIEDASPLADLTGGATVTIIVAADEGARFLAKQTAAIHWVDAAGTHDWGNAELVQVAAVEGDTIQVVRASSPVDFPDLAAASGGVLHIAPLYRLNEQPNDGLKGKFVFNLALDASTTRPAEDVALGYPASAWEAYARYLYDVYFVVPSQKRSANLAYFGLAADASFPALEITVPVFVPDQLALDVGWYAAGRCVGGPETKDVYAPDVDNDGAGDCGFIDGFQSWGRGSQLAMAELRRVLDEAPEGSAGSPADTRVLVDSDAPDERYRGFGTVDGIEMEHFPRIGVSVTSADYAPYISEGLVHAAQWAASSNAIVNLISKDDFPVIGCGAPTTKDADFTVSADRACGRDGNELIRIGVASAGLLGVAHTLLPLNPLDREAVPPDSTAVDLDHRSNGQGDDCYGLWEIDEYRGGLDAEAWGWLGVPIGPPVRVSSDLGTSIAVADWMDGATDTSADTLVIPPTDGSDEIDAESGDADAKLYASIDGATTATTWTVALELRSEHDAADPLIGLSDTFPAHSVKLKLTKDGKRILSVLHVEVPTDGQYHAYTLTFSQTTTEANACAGTSVSPDGLEIQAGTEAGTISVRNASVSPGSSNRWIGRFAEGAVLLNQSTTAWNADLSTVDPTGFYTRLRSGTGITFNDGMPGAGGGKRFMVPPNDALVVRLQRDTCVPVSLEPGSVVVNAFSDGAGLSRPGSTHQTFLARLDPVTSARINGLKTIGRTPRLNVQWVDRVAGVPAARHAHGTVTTSGAFGLPRIITADPVAVTQTLPLAWTGADVGTEVRMAVDLVYSRDVPAAGLGGGTYTRTAGRAELCY